MDDRRSVDFRGRGNGMWWRPHENVENVERGVSVGHFIQRGVQQHERERIGSESKSYPSYCTPFH